MKQEELLQILEEVGLSSHESQTYLTLLSLGASGTTDIARAADMKRTTVFSVLQRLQQKGMVRLEIKGFKKFYVAENPERLMGLLHERESKLEKLLPTFSSLYNLKGSDSSIQLYEGIEGIKNSYNNLLIDPGSFDTYMVISNLKQYENLGDTYFSKYTKRRSNAGIHARLLLQQTYVDNQKIRYEGDPYSIIKILPEDVMLTTTTVITATQVVTIEHAEKRALVITNPGIVKMHIELFNVIWSMLPNRHYITPLSKI
jgi:sugar-specific transcriptional regulator TrmB